MRGDSNLDDKRKENPKKDANFFSVIIFGYAFSTFKEGSKRAFSEEDLFKPLIEHKSSILGNTLAKLWYKEVERAESKKRTPSMLRAVSIFIYKDVLIFAVIVLLMELVVRLIQPLCVGLFVKYFLQKETKYDPNSPSYVGRLIHFFSEEQGPIQTGEAYFFASGILLTNLIAVLVTHPYYMACLHMGMKLRIACCSLIYRKALRLNMVQHENKSAGNPVNLLSNDVMRFDLAINFLHYIWISPLQLICIVYFIYLKVENAAFVGVSIILIVMPLQAIFGWLLAKFRFQIATRTDERVRRMNEIIQSVEVIKMYAWEFAFSDQIHKLRKHEVTALKKTAIIRGLIMSFIMFTARAATFMTAIAYVLNEKEITTDLLFTITTYYQILRQTMTVCFPQGIALISEALVSIERIRKYMLLQESLVGDQSILNPHESKEDLLRQIYVRKETPAVIIENGSATYGDQLCLDDISLEITPGITAITGPVGAGKTCLLNVILGEMSLFSGSISVHGRVVYASQESWLFAGTIRQNILFGRNFNKIKYFEVIRACSLMKDFQLLPYGDQTIVGERGVSLSGGQKARINLARTIYSDADIYLLDDPLSAVDTQVGQSLVEDCLVDYLQGKIVVLVTHQLQYLKVAQQIVIMSDGMIEQIGTHEFLQINDVNAAELMKMPVESTTGSDDRLPKVAPSRSRLQMKIVLSRSLHAMGTGTYETEREFKIPREEEPEMSSEGSMEWKLYVSYFKACGNWAEIILMLSLFIVAQALATGGDFLLAQWVTLEEYRNNKTNTKTVLLKNYNREVVTNIYSLVIIVTMAFAIFRAIYFVFMCMSASIRLHDQMFKSIIHASMNFFFVNTSGRILNRFSKDLGCVDEFLPTAMLDCFQIILNLIGATTILIFIEIYLIIPTVVMCIIFYSLRRVYLKTSISIKRLEGIVRSPVFTHLNSSLDGLATIRSNKAEKLLVSEFDELQDVHSSAWFMFLFTSRAFGMWLDLVCALYIGFVTFSFIMWSSDVDGGRVGLAITQCIGLSGLVQWGMRQSAELENQMTAVERVMQYTKVDRESKLLSSVSKRPSPYWPSRGCIEYVNVSMRYNLRTRKVLKDLTLKIKPQEKIGIVGRTGAGKSSLIATLFRLYNFEGLLIVDDIDIKKIALHDLRKKISIIPQNPVIFFGTLRYNLDPFHEYNDESIYNALVTVENKDALIHGMDCLQNIMKEGGSNLSVGQRQLVCLARALLRKNRILVMDEVTANVDPETDKFIQYTIRTKFSHCTVLTIAHRLHTIIDYDRVLVLDSARVREFDHPFLLLKKGGHFYNMVRRTGPVMARNLIQMAEESFKNKLGETDDLRGSSSIEMNIIDND